MPALPSQRLRGLSVGAFACAALVLAALAAVVVIRLVNGQSFAPIAPALGLLGLNGAALVLVGVGARQKSAELARDERGGLP